MGLNINIVVIAGRLGSDPELKITANKGASFCSFSLANTFSFFSEAKQEIVKETSWYQVKAWERLAEICASQLHKGDEVLVEGRLHQETWEDKEGKKNSKVKLLASRVHFIRTKNYEDRVKGATEPEPSDEKIPF